MSFDPSIAFSEKVFLENIAEGISADDIRLLAQANPDMFFFKGFSRNRLCEPLRNRRFPEEEHGLWANVLATFLYGPPSIYSTKASIYFHCLSLHAQLTSGRLSPDPIEIVVRILENESCIHTKRAEQLRSFFIWLSRSPSRVDQHDIIILRMGALILWARHADKRDEGLLREELDLTQEAIGNTLDWTDVPRIRERLGCLIDGTLPLLTRELGGRAKPKTSGL